ncbi:hypothetical protein [Kitasatospora aureofaciens]|uniref:hypothetical protein n=1 Tax=Kitasatospora aureofaciens TaxID=1894 RepID=UPI0034067B24
MGIEIDPGKTCVVVAAARILAAPGRVIDEHDGAPGREAADRLRQLEASGHGGRSGPAS